MRKGEILKVNLRLPDNATKVDVLDAIHFRLQVAKGLKDIAEGQVVTHAQLCEWIAQWRESAGH